MKLYGTYLNTTFETCNLISIIGFSLGVCHTTSKIALFLEHNITAQRMKSTYLELLNQEHKIEHIFSLEDIKQ